MPRLSARELREWEAYEEIFGTISIEERIDLHMGLIAERITNTTRHKGKPASVADFMWDSLSRGEPIDGGEDNSPFDGEVGT